MAKFVYKMQNILNVKYQLENQAKIAFSNANARLREEEEKLYKLMARKEEYEEESRQLVCGGVIRILDIQNCRDSVSAMKSAIQVQANKVQVAEKNVEQARIKLNDVMVDRKTHEKLREKKKKRKNGEESEEGKSSIGSKIAMFFVTLIIIAVWLVILALLVKWDVGGFGSTVLQPVLKDVPYINKILPDTGETQEPVVVSDENGEYKYDTIEEAVNRIKELEQQLQSAQDAGSNNDAQVQELQTEVDRLSEYEKAQKEFEDEKTKFYQEVVFGDNAPDISEYKKYYEEIDPENAQALYKQVVQQTAVDDELQNYVKMYSDMKPKQAAAIFDTMTNDLQLVAKILQNMDTTSSANILGAMSSDNAAKVTEIMEPTTNK